jgi:hypothetical protein
MKKTSLWLINKDFGGTTYVAADNIEAAMKAYKKAAGTKSDAVILSIDYIKHFILVDEDSLKSIKEDKDDSNNP